MKANKTSVGIDDAVDCFTVDDIVDRMPQEYRKKLKDKLEDMIARNKPIRIYCDGVFDMFHYGHARLFEQIKKMIPNAIVIAGVCSDKDVLREKGLFVMTETERVGSVENCKWVDEVFFPAPWYPEPSILRELNCDFIAHDCIPYISMNSSDCYKAFKEQGKFLPTLRTDGISTTNFIVRILRDKDTYISRSLKKGVEKDQLNLSFLDIFRITLKNKFENLVSGFKCDKKRKNR